MQIITTDPLSDPRWLEFVLAHPDRTVYHHPGWIRALQYEFRQQGEHLACVNDAGEFLAILPLVITQGIPFGLGGHLAARRVSSLPRTPLGGPLSKDIQSTQAILSEALRRTSKHRGQSLQLKTGTDSLDGLVEGITCTPWRMSYVLELPSETKGEFWIRDGQNRARIKWAVRKAQKSGVTVRLAQTEADYRAWYRLYLETMRYNGVPPRPFRLFTSLRKELGESGILELLVAEHCAGGRPTIIAGSLFSWFGNTVSYLFNAMDRRHGALRANDAIQWEAINEACRKGFRHFDFGEVAYGADDLAQFKSKWGALPRPMYRYYAPPPVNSRNDHAFGSHGGMKSLAIQVWRRLPLAVIAWLGDRIYSYL